MAYKFQLGSFTASGSLKAKEGFDAGDSNIANVGDIAVDSISADGNDVEIDLTDNRSTAFAIKESSNVYLRVSTDNSTEKVEFLKDLSGSADFTVAGAANFGAEQQTTISSVGLLSSSATATLANATFDRFTVASADINGGSIDNAAIGASTPAAAEFTTLSASSTLNVVGAANFGPADNATISAAGAGTFAGVSTTTLSASSTLNVVGASNFGPADNATISAAGAGTFAGVASTTLSASSTLNVVGVSNFGPGNLASISAAGVISGSGDSTIHKITMDRLVAATADINGGSLDDVTIGGSTPAAGTFTNISGSGTLQAAGIVTVGNGKLTVSAEGVLSGSATATLANATFDRFTVASADINGGAIDGTNIGASAQGTGEFTTLSASSTLNVAGASNFGPDNLASISTAGVMSGSGIQTFHRVTADRFTANGPISGSGGIEIAKQSAFGNGKLTIGNEGVLSSSATPTFNSMVADRITVNGSLTVNGTTTTVNSTTIEITNSFTFEGSSPDDFETTLGVVDPTADRSILLPNLGDGQVMITNATGKTIGNQLIPISSNGVFTDNSALAFNAGATRLGTSDLNVTGSFAGDGSSLTGITATTAQSLRLPGADTMVGASGDISNELTLVSPSGSTAVDLTLPTISSDDENGKVYVVKSISTKTSGSANIRIIAPADQRIDSETQIFIESPFGAVNLVVCSGSVEGRFYSIF